MACVLDAKLDLPFWPQLPRRGAAEFMLPQAASELGFLDPVDARAAGWRVTAAVRRPGAPRAAAFEPFRRAAAGRVAQVKGQWAGPVTLAAATLLDSGTTLGVEAPRRTQVFAALAQAVVAQCRALAECAPRVDLWIDEPLLGTAGSAAELAAWRAGLAVQCGKQVRLGLHCCAPPTPLLFELGFEVVSFDARDPAGAPAWLIDALAAQLERGVVAWGVLDSEPDRRGDVQGVVAAVSGWCARLQCSPGDIGGRSLVTPACGLAALTPEECAVRLQSLTEAGECLRSGVTPG